MNFQIRRVMEEDRAQVFDIYNTAIRDTLATLDTQPRDDAEQRAWMEQHRDDRWPAYVAIGEDGRVAGWATLSPWSSRCGYARAAEDSVYLHPDFHSVGLGRRMLQTLLDHAPRHGVQVVLARMVEDNAASVRLHERLGFSTVGVMRRVGEKFGRILDVRLMDRHLDR